MTIMQNMRLGVCGACENNKAKYTCPRCKFTSCSLKCVQTHKLESRCDGIRNKTSYIPKDRIAELDVLSDYRLLESTSRRVDSYSRDEIKKSTRKVRDPHAMPLPPHLIKFRNACYRRGRCRLHFLPQKFQRHQENTSRFVWKKNEIYWRIQLLLPHAYYSSSQKVILANVSENTTIYDLLQPYMVGTCENERKPSVESPNEKTGPELYDIYKTAGFSGVKVLLKSEGDFHELKRYHEIDISKCIKDNLSGKNIVEHPVLMIILNHHSDSFNISDGSDEEDIDANQRNINKASSLQGVQDHGSSNSPTSKHPNFNSVVLDGNNVVKAKVGTSFDTSGIKPSSQQTPYSSKTALETGGNTKESETRAAIIAPHVTTRREAEFNKNCYDFYLKYYSEKYGINSNIPMNMGAIVPEPQQSIIQKSPEYYIETNSNVGVQSGVSRNEAINRSSAQSLVANRLLCKSTNDQTSPNILHDSSINKAKSRNCEKTDSINKTNSLSLLEVYSDSEEEMES